jgi:hypothetical protein
MSLFNRISSLRLSRLQGGCRRISSSQLGTGTSEIKIEQNPEEEIQPYWKAMERRVVNRKSRQDGKSGRIGVRQSEEDFWLAAGLYDPKEPVQK